MEKTLTIDGKSVTFKSTAGTALRYKAQFRKDFFAELLSMMPMVQSLGKDEGKLDLEALTLEQISTIDFDVFYRLIWILAKTADPSIPTMEEWFDGFDTFPLMDVIPELQDLLANSLGTTQKKRQAPRKTSQAKTK